MFNIGIAELNIRIDNKYDYIKEQCREYLNDEKYDFCVSADFDEIAAEGEGFSHGYLESLAIYRKIAEKIVGCGGFLMHGAVIDLDGTGIAFLARSGVGKSVHVNLWKRLLKDKCTVINGDKPLVRIIGDKAFAYGTPWAGKEKMQTNAKTELKKICFIERAEKNECIRIEKGEAFEKLFSQIYLPKNRETLSKTLDLVGQIIEKAEFYIIKCNMDITAAKTAYEGIFGEQFRA